MKEIIVYRDKKTNKITTFHEVNKNCTDENIAQYNSHEDCHTKAEKVVLEDNSIELYFYELRAYQREELFDKLRYIEETISSLSSDIDDRLCELEEAYNKEGE